MASGWLGVWNPILNDQVLKALSSKSGPNKDTPSSFLSNIFPEVLSSLVT